MREQKYLEYFKQNRRPVLMGAAIGVVCSLLLSGVWLGRYQKLGDRPITYVNRITGQVIRCTNVCREVAFGERQPPPPSKQEVRLDNYERELKKVQSELYRTQAHVVDVVRLFEEIADQVKSQKQTAD